MPARHGRLMGLIAASFSGIRSSPSSRLGCNPRCPRDWEPRRVIWHKSGCPRLPGGGVGRKSPYCGFCSKRNLRHPERLPTGCRSYSRWPAGTCSRLITQGKRVELPFISRVRALVCFMAKRVAISSSLPELL
ncbi:hypothetical protein BDM02DRAFT_2530135 [Thelephora ganbajun]|uniref:Uncharacterized protein n=1 Tax=Thelephora ganbajun TaxID=370292 RepID=A0ACB6YY28_THEGA|nr:hypothetical protein BDM02DRAFT_2530135 [Thelephora ganbajun]